tara:strand:- start:1229 stop:4858 length:3630 start_codon:yes stop_codon:yes gene_type:complete
MENKIQDVKLIIPKATCTACQTFGEIAWTDIRSQLKVHSIEILYTESDSNAIKIIDTLDTSTLDITGNDLEYSYQSQKPWRTLPTADTTRVYDKVPIRALAQETAGNRVIYGNFVDKHTSPEYLEYIVSIAEKPPLPALTSDPEYNNEAYYVRKEYQNHTLKQNRTYQVGVVLSDRYGRQSDVTLTKPLPTDVGSIIYKDATIYHPYRDVESRLITDASDLSPAVPNDTWPGDQLNMLFTQVIPDVSSRPGYPGLYSSGNGEIIGWHGFSDDLLTNWGPGPFPFECCATLVGKGGLLNPAEVCFTVIDNGFGVGMIDPSSLVIENGGQGYYNGEIVYFNSHTPFPLVCQPGAGFSPFGVSLYVDVAPANHLGWYSYKIVVKQTEQEYYNVYLPGILAGYPLDVTKDTADVVPDLALTLTFPAGEVDRTSHVALINDNINKIPRDLNEVGPIQREFRSSVRLFGRVENIKVDVATNMSHLNRQYQPGEFGDTVSLIGSMTDLKLGDLSTTPWDPAITENLPTYDLYNLYSPLSDPLVAKLATEKQIGWPADQMDPFLAVYETEPVLSKLDIFWETTTSGLISELNHDILTDDPLIPTGISDPNLSINECDPPGSDIGGPFQVIGTNGQPLPGATITLDSVTDSQSPPIGVSGIYLTEPVPGTYQFKLNSGGFFVAWANTDRNNLSLNLTISNSIPPDPPITLALQISCQVNNCAPVPRNPTGTGPDSWGDYTRDGIKHKTFGWSAVTGSYTVPNKNGDIWMSYHSGPSTVNMPYNDGDYNPNNCDVNGVLYPYNGVGGGVGQPASPVFGIGSPMYQNCYGFSSQVKMDASGFDWTWSPFQNNNVDPTGFSTTAGTGGGGGGAASYPDTNIVALAKYDINMWAKWCGCWTTCPAGQFHVNTNWDGKFTAANGSYGSNFGITPVGGNTETELKWEIARVYQVSAFHGGEIIFGDNSWPEGSGYPRWISRGFPPGPVYRWSNPAFITDTGVTGIGETFCGQRYQPANPFAGGGRLSYWKDINILRNAGYIYNVTPNDNTLRANPNGIGDDIPKEEIPIYLPTTLAGTNLSSYIPGYPVIDYSTSLPVTYGPAVTSNCGATGMFYGGHIGDGSSTFGVEVLTASWIDQSCRIVGGIDPNSPMVSPSGNQCGGGWHFFSATPPGRYVVTLRVTDMAGDGLFYEWDVPIYIMPYSGTHWQDEVPQCFPPSWSGPCP